MKNILCGSLIVISAAIAVSCQSTPSTTNNTSSPSPTLEAQKPDANFDEVMYLFVNPDVKKLIEQGKYKSGLDRYTQVG